MVACVKRSAGQPGNDKIDGGFVERLTQTKFQRTTKHTKCQKQKIKVNATTSKRSIRKHKQQAQ